MQCKCRFIRDAISFLYLLFKILMGRFETYSTQKLRGKKGNSNPKNPLTEHHDHAAIL